jgi:hypothetical protein
MTDRRFSVDFTLAHPAAEPDMIAPLVEKLRREAVALGFHQVSELVSLKDEADIVVSRYGERFLTPGSPLTLPFAVFFFTCSLPDGDTAEIGVEQLPIVVECDEFVIPGGMLEWSKCGAVGTRDLWRLSKLLHFAAGHGFEASLAFGGTALDYRRVGGRVEVRQTWDTVPVTD